MEKEKDIIVYTGEDIGLDNQGSGFLTKVTKPKKLETKVIRYETLGDPLEISSMSHIVFPFFTSRVKNRNINLEYHFKDMGIKFFSVLNSDESLNIKQPGTFEEKIYNFILQKSFEVYEEEKDKLKRRKLDETTKEEVLKGILSSLEFTFDIPEVLEFLGLKKNPVYYKKIEEALANMKHTNYRFEKTNNSKFDKSFFEFESLNFSLINYERLKKGRKNYYKVHPSNFILEKTLKNKQYLYFTKESRKSIGDASSAALRIYKYISMKRFDKSEGTVAVEALAIIIPYELYSMNLSNGKEYKKNKINEVTRKIVKSFKSLKDHGYIKDFREILNDKGQPAIMYSFTDKLGLVTQYTNSQLIKKSETKKIKKNIEDQKENTTSSLFDSEALEKYLIKAKKNMYVSKAWNKRADNKINRIVNEYGEDYAIHILKNLYDGLKQEISKTLVQYINGIIKNHPYEEFLEEKEEKIGVKNVNKLDKTSTRVEVVEAQIVEEKEPKGPTKDVSEEQPDPMRGILYDMYLKLKEEEQEMYREKARELYLKETNSKSFNTVHEKIFKNLEKNYIIRIIKGE